MNAEDFLLAIRDFMPSREELEEIGLDSDEIRDIQASFVAVARGKAIGAKSELEKMVRENDCSAIEVGLVRFLAYPQVHRCGVHVAYCESDPIVVSATGVVRMHDHAADEHVLDCAVDSERFLDALYAVLAIKKEKSKWRGDAGGAVSVCAEKAGGSNFAPFFYQLFGTWGLS